MFDTAGAAEQKFIAGDGTGILISSAARSEIVQSDPAALAGPFPPEFDLATSYVLWHRKSAAPAVAAFAAEVATAEGRAVLQRHGLRAR